MNDTSLVRSESGLALELVVRQIVERSVGLRQVGHLLGNKLDVVQIWSAKDQVGQISPDPE